MCHELAGETTAINATVRSVERELLGSGESADVAEALR